MNKCTGEFGMDTCESEGEKNFVQTHKVGPIVVTCKIMKQMSSEFDDVKLMSTATDFCVGGIEFQFNSIVIIVIRESVFVFVLVYGRGKKLLITALNFGERERETCVRAQFGSVSTDFACCTLVQMVAQFVHGKSKWAIHRRVFCKK